MCDYCDCRELAPIGELSAEHERITRLASELRDALGSADEPRATAALAALAGALGPHLAKEERGLLAELAARDGFDWYVAELLADHERARSGILATRSAGPAERDLLLVELDDLAHHIETEEYDLFPVVARHLSPELSSLERQRAMLSP